MVGSVRLRADCSRLSSRGGGREWKHVGSNRCLLLKGFGSCQCRRSLWLRLVSQSRSCFQGQSTPPLIGEVTVLNLHLLEGVPPAARPRGREAAPRGRTGRATPSRAIRRRATARQASGDVVARGLAASNAGRDSSGSSSRPARRRTTKLLFKTSPARESRLGIRSSKPTTVKKLTYESLRSNQEAGRDLRDRPRTRDL